MVHRLLRDTEDPLQRQTPLKTVPGTSAPDLGGSCGTQELLEIFKGAESIKTEKGEVHSGRGQDLIPRDIDGSPCA